MGPCSAGDPPGGRIARQGSFAWLARRGVPPGKARPRGPRLATGPLVREAAAQVDLGAQKRAVLVFAGAQIHLVAADGGLLRVALAPVGQLLAFAHPLALAVAVLADLAADYGAQRINRAQFLAAQDPVHARLLLARRQLDQLTVDPSLDGTSSDGMTAETWDRLDLDQQRALVGLFIEHVVIRKGKRGRYFDPSRVQPVPVENGPS